MLKKWITSLLVLLLIGGRLPAAPKHGLRLSTAVVTGAWPADRVTAKKIVSEEAKKRRVRAIARKRAHKPVMVLSEFEKHKGQLPWPLAGRISMPFGPYAYMKNIVHNNVGITIDVPEGTPVHAVYDGFVSKVDDFEGVQYVVLRHGNYLTCYSNLASTNITEGQHIRMGETLGCVGSIGQLEFMLSNKKNRYFDPQKWLRR